MIAHIYIEGQIGTSYKEDGTVDVKGVELQDVISQYRKNADAEKVIAHIISQGGHVDVGRKIAHYLGSLPNVYTLAEIQCASIATEIHLSVPVERRQVAQGTSYLIHQPMFSFQRGIALNKDELATMSTEIGHTQAEMVNNYAKATGMDKVSLELLMQQETALTPEQCVEFGFASEIVTNSILAVALINPKTNSQNEIMTKLEGKIDAMRIQLAQFIAGKPIKAVSLDLTTLEGVKVVVVTEADAPKVGDAVTDAEGNPVADGEHIFEKIKVVTVGGVITEIMDAIVEDAATVEALTTELETLKAEREAEQTALAELQKEFTQLAKLSSNYKPAPQKVAFRKQPSEPSKDGSTGAAAIREARQAKKDAQSKK